MRRPAQGAEKVIVRYALRPLNSAWKREIPRRAIVKKVWPFLLWLLAAAVTGAYTWSPVLFESVAVNLGVSMPDPQHVFDDPYRRYCLYVFGFGTVLGTYFAIREDAPYLMHGLLIIAAISSLFAGSHFFLTSVLRTAIWKYATAVRHDLLADSEDSDLCDRSVDRVDGPRSNDSCLVWSGNRHEHRTLPVLLLRRRRSIKTTPRTSCLLPRQA